MIKLLQVLGRLREAERRCREALRFVEERGMARLPAAGILHVALAEVLVEQNRLAEAESHLSRGLDLGKGSGRLDAVRNAPAPLSRLRQARRDTAGALAAIEDAEMALGEASAPEARALLLALKARIQLRKGSLAEAARCIEEAECLVGRDRGHASAAVAVAAARVMLAVSEPEEAISQLTQSLTQAEQSGRLGSALELRILRSLAHARNGDIRQAEKDLEKALAQAEPEGYVRIFVDEGEPMEALLRRLATRHGLRCKTRGYSPGYVLRLLAAFGESPGGVQAGPDRNRATAGASEMERVAGRIGSEHVAPLVEALSEREMQVLRLMAAGRTNKQIAAELVVAVGTVKTHIHHICGKLGGQNRAHAIARARELDLL
jgi:LuxR family maltose regulon positive regulatory protein